MSKIDEKILQLSSVIDKHFNKITKENRDEESVEILSHLRNFCEVILYKIYNEENNCDLLQTQENLTRVRQYSKEKYHSFYEFHTFLDAGPGHIFCGKEHSESLMIKYIPKLIEMKIFIKEKYNLDTLLSINKFPINLDDSLIKFYKKILSAMTSHNYIAPNKTKDLYYIKKKSMKYICGKIFYEYVLDISDDKPNKFNTIVAYSFVNITLNYDMIFSIYPKMIELLGKDIKILIIKDYEIAIRPCAFKNLLSLININLGINSRTLVYKDLMNVIKKENCNLLTIIQKEIPFSTRSDLYNKFIDEIHSFISTNQRGTNLIKYLLLNMRNSTIILQKNKHRYKNSDYLNPYFNYLPITSGSLEFDKDPVAFNPRGDAPTFYEINQIVDVSDYKESILYKSIEEYINSRNLLFVTQEEIYIGNENINYYIDKFNSKLTSYYSDNEIIKIGNKYTIKFYLEDSLYVFNEFYKLIEKEKLKVNTSTNFSLSDEQRNVINNAFKSKSICFLCGSAGTGKSTVIKEFIECNKTEYSIICLTTTNTAKNNLMSSINTVGVHFYNIAAYIKSLESKSQFNIIPTAQIIILDEASFISTVDMAKILRANPNSIYFIVGDPYQIESIQFGNWYELALNLFKNKNVVYELKESHRTNSTELLRVWNLVRNVVGKGNDTKLIELLSGYDISKRFNDDSIFELNKNQIILCLGYEGIYGINNLNRYLQISNTNTEHIFQQQVYKVNDPIVFVINDYEEYGIYNNLNGIISEITEDNEYIYFKIDVLRNMNYFGKIDDEISILDNIITIRKKKNTFEDYDNDLNNRVKLPFQISYAMSMHKAQGLEYDNVKIIITKDNEEYISKNIFYTAITRARKKLEIYWDPEIENSVINNMKEADINKKSDLGDIKRLINEKSLFKF